MTIPSVSSPTVKPVNLLPDAYAIPAMALTVIIMAHSTLVGLVAILVFYALWLPQLVLRTQQVLSRPGTSIFILLLPVLCAYSVFWSYAPGRSIYFGIQFISMVLCTIIMARTVSINALLKGLSLGCLVVLAASVSSGNYQRDYFTDELSLFGYFSSKNQVGLFSTVGVFCGVLLLFTRRPWWERLVFGLATIGVGLVALHLSKSASSLLSLGAVLGVTAAATLLSGFERRLRAILLVFGILVLATGFLYFEAFSLNVQDAALQSVGKDSTLTGRTYLWGEGLKAAFQKPWLGWGYSGFWAHGQPLAERYWAEFGIDARDGFHFHNTFVQTFVDTGFPGLFLIVGLVLLNLLLSVRALLRQGMNLTVAFSLGFAFMFFIRAFVEVDFLGQYSIGTLLSYYIIPLLTRQDVREART